MPKKCIRVINRAHGADLKHFINKNLPHNIERAEFVEVDEKHLLLCAEEEAFNYVERETEEKVEKYNNYLRFMGFRVERRG